MSLPGSADPAVVAEAAENGSLTVVGGATSPPMIGASDAKADALDDAPFAATVTGISPASVVFSGDPSAAVNVWLVTMDPHHAYSPGGPGPDPANPSAPPPSSTADNYAASFVDATTARVIELDAGYDAELG